jgi:plasmid maintenance system antidote protein VapI
MPMKSPAHPGRIARTAIEAAGQSVTDIAAALGVPFADFEAMLDGRARLSDDVAAGLSRLVGGPVETWTALRSAHDRAATRAKASTAA